MVSCFRSRTRTRVQPARPNWLVGLDAVDLVVNYPPSRFAQPIVDDPTALHMVERGVGGFFAQKHRCRWAGGIAG